MAKKIVAMIIVSLSIPVESHLFGIIWSWHTKHYLHLCVEDTSLVCTISVCGDTSLKRYWCLQGYTAWLLSGQRMLIFEKKGGMHDLRFLVCPLVGILWSWLSRYHGPISQSRSWGWARSSWYPNLGWTYLSPMVLTKAHSASECPWGLSQIQLFQLHPKHTESEFPGMDSIWRYINRLIAQFVKLPALLLLKMKNLRHERMADARATIS